LAGICCNTSSDSKTVGLPSIRTVKFELPLSSTFPSISTFTEGVFSSTSTAVPPAAFTS